METEISKAREGWALPEEGTDCRGAEGDIKPSPNHRLLVSSQHLTAQPRPPVFLGSSGEHCPHVCFSHALTWRGVGGWADLAEGVPTLLSQGPLQAELPHEKQVRFRMSACSVRFELASKDPEVACPIVSQLHASLHLAQAEAWSPSLLHSLTQA